MTLCTSTVFNAENTGEKPLGKEKSPFSSPSGGCTHCQASPLSHSTIIATLGWKLLPLLYRGRVWGSETISNMSVSLSPVTALSQCILLHTPHSDPKCWNNSLGCLISFYGLNTTFMLMILNLYSSSDCCWKLQLWRVICLLSISTWISKNELDGSKQNYWFSLPNLSTLIPTTTIPISAKKWHCHSSKRSGQKLGSSLIFHFLSSSTSNPLAYIVKFSFEMYAKADRFLPTSLLPVWLKSPSSLISTIARATSMVFSPQFLLHSQGDPFKM